MGIIGKGTGFAGGQCVFPEKLRGKIGGKRGFAILCKNSNAKNSKKTKSVLLNTSSCQARGCEKQNNRWNFRRVFARKQKNSKNSPIKSVFTHKHGKTMEMARRKKMRSVSHSAGSSQRL